MSHGPFSPRVASATITRVPAGSRSFASKFYVKPAKREGLLVQEHLHIGFSAFACLALLFGCMLTCFAQSEHQTTLRSIGSLSDFDISHKQTVVLRGVVTYSLGTTVYVQDQTGAIRVLPINPPPLALGDEVELTGIYTRNGQHASIQSATIHRLWSGSQPVPLALTPEQAAEGEYNSRLIEVEGRLIQKQMQHGGATFAMEGEQQFFAVRLDLSSPGSANMLSQFDPGSILRLTGICSLPLEKGSSSPVSFSVLLRSADDIRVISPAPWWNLRHAAMIAVGFIALLFLFHRIRVHNLGLRFRAVMEERSRLAREMHDTLAQGFSGVALQLENLANELRRSSQTPFALRQLELALRMVRHSREEAYGSIFVLRSLASQDLDLLKTLAASARLKMNAQNVEIFTKQTGDSFALPADTAHNLIRIGQEAIANAIRHSGASEIDLVLVYSSSSITLSVLDNGSGFDVENANSTGLGHFGLAGMRERAARINATIHILSPPGDGTNITVIVPKCNSTNGLSRNSDLFFSGK